jgi:hypothetical protein
VAYLHNPVDGSSTAEGSADFFLVNSTICVLLPFTWSEIRSLPRCTLIFPQECFNRSQSYTVSQYGTVRRYCRMDARTLKHTRITILYSTSMKTNNFSQFAPRTVTNVSTVQRFKIRHTAAPRHHTDMCTHVCYSHC